MKKKKDEIPFLPLAALAFLTLATASNVAKNTPFPRQNAPVVALSPIPKNQEQEPVPQVSAKSALVLDPRSAVVLFEKDVDRVLSPASTTKMLTAWVVLSNFTPTDVIQVPEIDVEPQVMKLVPGERITISDLLYGILVWSANDAAEVVAAAFPGGRNAFISEMNRVAQEFGMSSSHFANPSGLPENNHASTARDLARFATLTMKNAEFAEIVKTRDFTARSTDGKISHKLVNLNELLGKVPGVLGIKTGWTEDSGGSLVSFIDREGKELVVVVLGSEDRFGDSERLIEWAYTNHEWHLPLD